MFDQIVFNINESLGCLFQILPKYMQFLLLFYKKSLKYENNLQDNNLLNNFRK